MKEMQANIIQHKVIISTVRNFFRNPVLFFIRKLQVSKCERWRVIQFNLYSLNIVFMLRLSYTARCCYA